MTFLRDLELGSDKEVRVDGSGDLAQTSGDETVQQSIAIHLSTLAQDLLGSQLTGTRIERFESRVEELDALDEQVSDVESVRVTLIDEAEQRIELEVVPLYDDSFTVEVTP